MTEEVSVSTRTFDSERQALESLLVLDAGAIEAMDWEPVHGCPGVYDKQLWRYGSYVEALVRFDAGAVGPGVPHLVAHHHIWVVSGTATIAGRRVGPGSYIHVPPGAEHRVEEVGADGCVLLQMHRPHAPQEAESRSRW